MIISSYDNFLIRHKQVLTDINKVLTIVQGSQTHGFWIIIILLSNIHVNLDKRGVIVSSNLYFLCKKDEETVQHVFINYKIAQKVWNNCDRWIRIFSVRQKQ